jgi:hypothetical protein
MDRLRMRKKNVIMAPAASCPGVPGMMKMRIEVINNLWICSLSEHLLHSK